MAGQPFTALSADDEDSYRLQIAGLPRLSSEEEQRLLATRGQAREAANKKLIEHNLDLVFEAAYARRERGVPFGDLFQEGTVGLISAVEHYRAPADSFRASLRTAIAAVMDDILAQTADAQRNDEAFVKACRLLETAQRLLAGRLQRPATTAELAKLLRWEEDRVLVIQDMLDGARTIHDRELLEYLDDLESRDDEAG
jgi:RNA polymerase nonessential primary-like sigma factor